MKIKGFWKGYVNLCKASMEWLKDYWLLYTLICVVWAAVWFLPDMIRSYKASKKGFHPDDDQDLDDFLDF